MASAMDLLDTSKMTRRWTWGLPLAAAIIAVDQWSKQLVLADAGLRALACKDGLSACGTYTLVGPVFNDKPFFSISMMWNRGVSFGALQSEGVARWGLFLVTLAIAVGFAIWLLRAQRPLTAVSLSMVIGGAVGNMIDRAIHGAVVDFLDFSGFFFPWVFNVADASISLGAVVLLVDQLLASRKKPE